MLRTIAIAACAAALLASPAFADKMTNQSVIDLTKAKMSDDVIITAIQSGTPAFDTSSKGLVALKNAGVSDTVMKAILSANASPAPAATPAAASSSSMAAGGMTPETATLIDHGSRTPMKYLTPNLRHVVAPYVGMRIYSSLTGLKAAQRTDTDPKFLIAVPNNAQPESYFTLAHLAKQKNGNREVLVGGGYYGYSTGITKDRVVACTSAKAGSQAGAPSGFTMYEITPSAPLLKNEEYALVLYSSVVRSTGWFASGMDSYFDFGVD